MRKLGFIGYGHMAQMLIDGFLSSSIAKPSDIAVSTRTSRKLDAISRKWPGVEVSTDNKETARKARILFLCVKPLTVLPVLSEIAPVLSPKTHVISISSSVPIKSLEQIFHGKISKIIPSITSAVFEGTSLSCHNAKVTSQDRKNIKILLQAIGEVAEIPEDDFKAAMILTSCGPGLFAAMLDNFVAAALRYKKIPRRLIRQMAVSTFFGTAKLLKESDMDFSELVDLVATKGGVTQEGVDVLNSQLPSTFEKVFKKSLRKIKSIEAKVKLGNP
jgi:pyrroline-5-carboxylate reductase